MLGLEYDIALNNIDMAADGVICHITAAAAVPLIISHIELGTRTPTSPAGTGVRLWRASDNGTGGVANTPRPVSAALAAAQCTVLDAQTVFSLEPTLTTECPGVDFDALGNFVWRVRPESGIIVPGGGQVALNIEVDPSATWNWSGFIHIHEIR